MDFEDCSDRMKHSGWKSGQAVRLLALLILLVFSNPAQGQVPSNGTSNNTDLPDGPPSNSLIEWVEITSRLGALNLRNDHSTIATSLKQLPDGWAIYVSKTLDDSGNPIVEDGYRWYQVRDETDGTSGWMAAGKWSDGAFVGEEYLKYNPSQQEIYRNKADILDDTSRASLAGVVENAIDHYYRTSDSSNTLEGASYKGGLLSFLSTAATPFPEQLIAAIVLQESGGINFDNERVAGDFGFGVMQDNTYKDTQGQVGEASLIRIPSCEGYAGRANCFEPVLNKKGEAVRQLYKSSIAYRYYVNSRQSIFSNVKDGFAKVYALYKDSIKKIPESHPPWPVEYNGTSYIITVPEMRILRTVRGYNGFGPNCYRFDIPDKNNYLTPVANNLSKTAIDFPLLPSDAPADLDKKMKAVELHKTEVSLCSPGLLRIIDGEGNVVGREGDIIQSDIPTVLYDEGGKAAIIYLADDSYKYQVIGTDAGAYSLYIDNTASAGTSTVEMHDLPLALGEIYTYQVNWSAIAHDEPGVTIQIDTNGDGVIEKTIESGSELTADGLLLLTETVVNIDPATINRKSGSGIMTAYIELPSEFDVNAIDASSITLNGKPALSKPMTVGDHDGDGIPDLMVKFNRGIILPTLPQGDSAALTIAGEVLHHGKMLSFEAQDTVRVVQ